MIFNRATMVQTLTYSLVPEVYSGWVLLVTWKIFHLIVSEISAYNQTNFLALYYTIGIDCVKLT